MERVKFFAKDTGDFIGLSKVDMQLIALGVTMTKERGEGNLIRKAPKDLVEFKPASLKIAYDKFQSESEDSEQDDSDSDKQQEATTNEDDNWDIKEDER